MPAALAMQKVIDLYLYKVDIPIEIYFGEVESTRRLIAKFLRVTTDEIAFVKNTTQGILIAMNSIPWKKGDNVIVLSDAFAANLYPFRYLWPGVEKRYLKTGDGRNFLDRLKKLTNRKTKAVSVDYVNWLSGVRLDLKEISDFCQKRGIFLIVDAIQGLGALDIDLKNIKIDFLTAGISKWLLGPHGVGIFYVARDKVRRLVPNNIGWLSADVKTFYKLVPLPGPKKNAARFEEGTKNFIGICGFKECMKVFLDGGIDNIEQRVLYLTEIILEKAREWGFEILTPTNKKMRSGIVTIRPRNANVMKTYEKLRANNIIVSLREGWFRISPHFYNTESEINQMFKILK